MPIVEIILLLNRVILKALEERITLSKDRRMDFNWEWFVGNGKFQWKETIAPAW